MVGLGLSPEALRPHFNSEWVQTRAEQEYLASFDTLLSVDYLAKPLCSDLDAFDWVM